MQLTADQLELKSALRRFLAENVSPEYRRERINRRAEGSGRSDSVLTRRILEDLGLREGFGGAAPVLSFAELALAAEECGRALLSEPICEQLLGSILLPRFTSEQVSSKFRATVTGQGSDASAVGVAVAPPACCAVVAESEDGVVHGRIDWALGVDDASHLLMFVHVNGTRRAALCSVHQSGVTLQRCASLDLTVALNSVQLSGVRVEVMLSGQEGDLAEDLFEIVKAAEVYGLCERVLEMSVEYVTQREQFGQPVGAFQGVQHPLAHCCARVEALGALSRFAAWCVEHDPAQRPLVARAAAAEAAAVGVTVCETAIQVHGGIGFTWEYDLHLFLRRAKAIQSVLALTELRVDQLLERARGGG
jgi:alkylation response protein AidB-like acyl-CoA dehydrogenase